MVETVGFLACQREHLLRARREIAHGFVTHTWVYFAIGFAICPIRLSNRKRKGNLRSKIRSTGNFPGSKVEIVKPNGMKICG
jgi:hypothetical protein